MTIVFMTLSGILQYDMIDYYLFVTYVICVRARNSKLVGRVIRTMFIFWFHRLFFLLLVYFL